MSATDRASDILPILADGRRGFDQALRGYDRGQVDEYFGSVEDELRVTAADRDRVLTQAQDLATQLAAAQTQVESLRRQLRAATEAVTPLNVDERVRHAIDTARDEAARIRAEAQTQAEVIRNGASDGAARTRAAAHAEAERVVAEATQRLASADETFRDRVQQAQRHKDQTEADLARSLAQVRSEEAALTAEAQAQRTRLDSEGAAELERLVAEQSALRDRLDAESQARREQADQDFEIALRERRSAQRNEIAAERAEAHDAAERAVAEAEATARQLVDDATREVRRLYGQRDQTHSALRALHSTLGVALDEALAATPPAP